MIEAASGEPRAAGGAQVAREEAGGAPAGARAFLAQRGVWIAWILLFAVTLFAYRRIASLGFTDEDGLVDFTAARVDGLGDLLHQLNSRLTGGLAAAGANFYRPVVMLHYSLQRAVLGFSAPGFQLWDLGLHLGVVGMVGWLVTSLGGSKVEAWTAAAIVALHPLGIEIVPAVARSIDTLLALFVLGALIAVVKKRPVAAGVLGLLALGSKELAITVLPLLVVLWWVLHRRDRIGWLVILLGVGTPAFLIQRARVLSGWGGYTPTLFHFEETAMLFRSVSWEVLFPGWSPQIERAITSYRWQVLSGAALLGALPLAALLSWRRGDRRPALGVALFLLPILLLNATGLLSRRLYYVPMIGTALALAAWLRDPRLRFPAAAVVISLLPASPLFHVDDSWRQNDQVTQSITSAVEAELAALPAGTTVWLVDLCERINSDPVRARTFVKGGSSCNNCVTRRSVQAWGTERFGTRVRFRLLTSVTPTGALPAPDVTAGADGVVLRRASMGRMARESASTEWEVINKGGRLQSLRPRPGLAEGRLLIAGGDRGVLLPLGAISFEGG
jgi:hypothetical protein